MTATNLFFVRLNVHMSYNGYISRTSLILLENFKYTLLKKNFIIWFKNYIS